MHNAWPSTLLLLVALATPAAARQLEGYLGQPAYKLFVAPGRAFRVDLQSDWVQVAHPEDPALLEFKPASPLRAFIQVRRLRVPAGASPTQLALHGLEQRLRRLPGWQEQGQRKAVIGGRPATVVTGSYHFQGNAQYPITLEEVFVVVDEEAFIIHFECFSPAAGDFLPALERFYASFVPRPAESQLRPPPRRDPTDVPY